MNTMRHVVFLLTNIIVTIINFDPIDGTSESNECSDQEYSPLCFCRSSYRHSILTDRFLAEIFLSQCDDSFPTRHCHRSQFHPSSFNLIQLTNLSHCFEDIHCLHTLHSTKHCRQCQLTSLSLTHNNTYHTDACFNFCEHNTSCGFICLNQPVILSINCHICQNRKQNLSCRCIKIKQSLSSCLPSSYKTTTPRWMQKRGFPAAGILVFIMLAGALLVIALKLTYRQMDIIDRRRSIANQQLLLHQVRHLSPSTPQIVHQQIQELVVEIHRCTEENELNILLLKKSSKN